MDGPLYNTCLVLTGTIKGVPKEKIYQELVLEFLLNNFFKNSFFLSTIIEQNNLDPCLRKSESFSVFKNDILKFIWSSSNSVYTCQNPGKIYLITRLRLGLSHLREHKFKHGFHDMLNLLSSCGNYVESTEQFFLHCPRFVNERRTLLSI